MTVWAYIDGFNLYYRAIREAEKSGKGNQRWLNVVALSRKLASRSDRVDKVKYFTAEVLFDPRDPMQQQRQRDYWAALRTLPELEIIPGQFRADRKRYPRWDDYRQMEVDAANGVPVVGRRLRSVEVWKPEEKGSDVNLATHLVHDAHSGRFDKALVISNDSDLAESVRIVVTEIGRPVVVCNPSSTRPVASLLAAASEVRRIRQGTLAQSQLPDPVMDPETGRAIHRPAEWR